MSDTPTTLERAISAVLLADHGQRHWLKEPHPPFTATDALAVAHYGEPGAGLDLWRMCRAVEMLRVAVGSDDPIPAPLSPTQPVEAVPGLDGGESPAGVLGAPTCRFDYRMDPGITPDQPCPVCGDLGTFPCEDDPPSRCVAPSP